jgi:hypothetical protein
MVIPLKSQPEMKLSDATTTSGVADTTGAIVLVSNIGQDLTIGGRIGNKIYLSDVVCHIHSTVTPSTGIDQVQRWMLVWDRQPNGATAAIADVLATSDVYAQINVKAQTRFHVFRDSLYTLNASAEPGSDKVWSFKLPIRRIVTYIGTGTNASSIGSGALLLLTLGSVAPGVTAGSVNWTIRTRFTDQ